MCETAIRNIVSLSGFRANVLHVGTISQSSLMYAVILFLRRRSISQWLSLCQKLLYLLESANHLIHDIYLSKV